MHMKDMKCGETNEKMIFQFLFFELLSYFTQKCKFSMNFHNNSKNKNWKIDLSIVSAHCASSIKTGSKLRGGGGALHVLSWDRALNMYVKINAKMFSGFIRIF